MENIKIILWSMGYIFLILGIASAIAHMSKGASETSRKFVHIFVGNWVFFISYFTNIWAILFIPATFIIINSLSLRHNLIPAMERNDDSLGTVYYAISMFVLSGAGFILGWMTLPFIGLLTMAYGDGLAAIVGGRWGRRHLFSFAPKKTLAGSMTVAIAAFIVTLGSILLLQGSGTLRTVTIPMAVFIAILNSVFSAFIELTGKKGCDNLVLPIGSGLFATLCLQFGSIGLLIYMAFSFTILITAYKLHSITPDGIVAASLTAITLYTLGGQWIGISLLVFFVLGSLVSKFKNEYKRKAESLQEESGARNWKQVLSNSLPACVVVWITYIYPENKSALLLAFAVFSASAADTFSSEIGMMSKGKVFNILTGKPMASGLSGGVSLAGFGAGLVGSLLLSIFALPQFGWEGMIFVVILGFLGTIFDSVIGVILQSKYIGSNGQLQDRANSISEKPVKGLKIITNNAVNFITLSLVPISGHLFCFFISR